MSFYKTVCRVLFWDHNQLSCCRVSIAVFALAKAWTQSCKESNLNRRILLKKISVQDMTNGQAHCYDRWEGHAIYKLTQWHLPSKWVTLQESINLCKHSKVLLDLLLNYIKARHANGSWEIPNEWLFSRETF